MRTITTATVVGAVLAVAVGLLTSPTLPVASATPRTVGASPADWDLERAVSDPRSDSVYPDIGHQSVDALSYDLDLTWQRKARTLTGRATIVMRAALDADRISLDLGSPLEVSSVTVDGDATTFRHRGKNLFIDQPQVADERHTVVVDYHGHPRSVPWPTHRSDGTEAGWLVDEGGRVSTFQEPYGAFTWYPVNDHPSDKAFYSFTLTAPRGWTGVANGALTSRSTVHGHTVTRWKMDAPAASYLVTTGFDDFATATATSASGVPITYWAPADKPRVMEKLQATPDLLDWLEQRLGAYPFSTLSVLVVPGQSAMETQSTVTLGKSRYTLSKSVLLHEIAHQWYGDLVTPSDWSDLWMNEGMATFLQYAWTAGTHDAPLSAMIDQYTWSESRDRRRYGPPAAYHADAYGMGNVYSGGVLLWDSLYRLVGHDLFWRLVQDWPQTHPYGNSSYDEITGWWSQQTGTPQSFFDKWLRGAKTPDRPPLTLPVRPGSVASSVDGNRPATRRSAQGEPTQAELREGLRDVGEKLRAYRSEEGRFPGSRRGARMTDRILRPLGNWSRYLVNADGSEACAVASADLPSLAYDSGSGRVVSASPDATGAGCDRLLYLDGLSMGAVSRLRDAVLSTLFGLDSLPASVDELRYAWQVDPGYLFPPRKSPHVTIASYRVRADAEGNRRWFGVCLLDDRGVFASHTVPVSEEQRSREGIGPHCPPLRLD